MKRWEERARDHLQLPPARHLMRRRERLSLSPEQQQHRSSTPERRPPRTGSSLRQRVQRARGGGGESAPGAGLHELQYTARWAVGQEALEAAVLQYDFHGQFVQLIDARRSPLEWRDTTQWASSDGGGRSEWRLTASHSGEVVDEARGEARHEIAVHLDEVCPNVQSLFFVVCARDSTVGRAVSRPQVGVRTLGRGGSGGMELPVLLPLGSAAAAAGSAVICRVWRRSVADGWAAERVGLPAPAVQDDQYDGLVDAVASWLSVQTSARSAPPDDPGPAVPPMRPLPPVQSPHSAGAGTELFTARGSGPRPPSTAAAAESPAVQDLRRQNLDLQADLESVVEEGAEACQALEVEVARLREDLAQSKEKQHAASQQTATLKTANHELQALVRSQRTASEKAMRKAVDSHAKEVALLNQRRRSAATSTNATTARTHRPGAGPTATAPEDEDEDEDEETDGRSRRVLLAELQALQAEHDAKCEELACSQDELSASNARLDVMERELKEQREQRDAAAVDAIMGSCADERVESVQVRKRIFRAISFEK